MTPSNNALQPTPGGAVVGNLRLSPGVAELVRPLTRMKAVILLILSCASLMAADTNGQVSLSLSTNGVGQVFRTERSVSTNRETGEVLTTETLTHDGQTNLVRTTRSQRGAVAYR